MDNFDYKKSLGQNFIKDDNIIDKIVNYSGVDKDTLVIEIGPGAGSLSKKIIPLSGYSILYEIDKRLESFLNEILKDYDNYELIIGDFLNQDLSELRDKYRYEKIYVVANLPYYITTAIINKLMKELYPDKIVIMVQEEVANRLSAKCGSRNYGMISVLLGSKYEIKKLFNVSRKCFVPMPNVDSSVILLSKSELIGIEYDQKFEDFIKAAFKFKRKNLKNNLFNYDLDLLDKLLKKYGYSLTNRAEDIPVSVFIEIVKLI